MAKADFIEKQFNITPVLSKDHATHRLGGHLNNVWTNIPVTSAVSTEGINFISDHSLIQVKLKIGKEIKRYIPHKAYRFYSEVEIRRTI